MKKVRDGEMRKKREKRKKIMEIVTTNVVASQPPNGDLLQLVPI